ncbi:Retrovirus-related Pol polyprotein from transposon 17.6 [Thelohanellus kitauei]|uniref:Retrovirus-related Pol polyprotein from transposon 17.6 n=1 Tax=Thelohanellus kitauei TaxID=669202 RepID=A0A0C2M0I3_THEKT|nr:Retrovirus-related Pol polyprotein from transposon 17.6 [Thelohanellus kitauei]
MSFGLNNAPATFQRIIDQVFQSFDFVCAYLDDVVIFSKDFDEHKRHLEMTKCTFAYGRINFLGYEIDKNDIDVVKQRIEPILNIKRLINVKALRRLLGMWAYYHNLLEIFSEIALLLYEQTKLNENFIWTNEQERSFVKIKEKLASLPELTHLKPDSKIILRCDPSGKALGGVISQLIDGKELPISFASRVSTKAEMNYSTFEREILVIVFGVRKFRTYLLGRDFVIQTDHNPLKYIMGFNDAHNRKSRISWNNLTIILKLSISQETKI